MSNWDYEFEYEQGTLEDIWAFKFDHSPLQDGGWHRLNSKSRGWYRSADGIFQYVYPNDQAPDSELPVILKQIAEAGPLEDVGSPEILIRKRGTSFYMTSQWIFLAEGVAFRQLNRTDLGDAYRKLSELEDQR